MKKTQANVAQTFVDAYNYIGSRPDLFADIIRGKTYRQLGALIVRLEMHARSQSGTRLYSKTETQVVKAARMELIEQLKTIVSIAAPGTLTAPELSVLTMPKKLSNAGLLAGEASAIVGIALKHKADFIDAGLPSNFFEQIDATMKRMMGSRTAGHLARSSGTASTTVLETDIIAARKLLKTLNQLVRQVLRAQPELLPEWKAVKRFPTSTTAAALPAPASPLLLEAGDQSADAASETPTVADKMANGIRRALSRKAR